MKTQIVLALAFLAVSVSAYGYGVDILNLLQNQNGQLIAKRDLKYITASQINQYTIIMYFFNQGNPDNDNLLDFDGFKTAYNGFIYFLTGETLSEGLLLARWELADFAGYNDQI